LRERIEVWLPSHESVRQVRRGLRRTLGTAARHPAHAPDLAEITAIVAAIDPTTPAGALDRAPIPHMGDRP
jgi:hypothetical protein